MSVKIVKNELENSFFKVNSLSFLPESPLPIVAVFAHGYTSHKGDCLNWAQRLSEANIPSIIFDWPGHYLGSFNDVENFSDFKDHGFELFETAFDYLWTQLSSFGFKKESTQLILGGHSLGALLSLKALDLPTFSNMKKLAIAVGYGIHQGVSAHLFETSFYEKTLNIRRQLVSPALDSDVVFTWIREEKLKLPSKGQRIHLICGKDDVVVGPGGVQAVQKILEDHSNIVTLDEPTKLPHHEPGAAASSIYQFIKKELNLSAKT